MKAECCLKSKRVVKKYMKNETRCTICENTVFRVDRITPELIMLTCENCGEPHMIGINSDEKGAYLTFWSPEPGVAE
jgi:translation initiation factor 2 beta subunit (eIF-2beta)/eIF-5